MPLVLSCPSLKPFIYSPFLFIGDFVSEIPMIAVEIIRLSKTPLQTEMPMTRN
jgi:hypothetical protein